MNGVDFSNMEQSPEVYIYGIKHSQIVGLVNEKYVNAVDLYEQILWSSDSRFYVLVAKLISNNSLGRNNIFFLWDLQRVCPVDMQFL